MSNADETRIYDALALPAEALNDGGVEILRAGIINDELYVMARRAFKEPARWGEVLADIARELALFQSAEDTGLTEQEILTEIEQAFAADLGAPRVATPAKPKAAKSAKPAKPKAAAKRNPAKKAPPKPAKRKKR